MAKTILEAICERCEQVFKYEAAQRAGGGVFKRYVCDACKQRTVDLTNARRNKVRSALRKGENEPRFAGGDRGKGVVRMTQQEAANLMGLSKRRFEELERQVLVKIRNNSDLMELWNRFKEEGGDSATGILLPGNLFPQTDIGRSLLDYQLKVIEWWQTHDSIDDARCRKEYLRELAKFQRIIAETLNKILSANGNT